MVIVLVLGTLAGAALAEETLDIDAAVSRALATGEVQAQIALVEEARGRLEQALVLPNPQVTYDRQDIFDEGIAPGFVQDLVKVEQALPGSQRRRARRAVGEREIDRVALEVDVVRRRKAIEVRRAFVRAVEAERVAAIHDEAIARVGKGEAAIEARVSAGESSKYERLRVRMAQAQERDLAFAARADASRLRGELGATMAVPVDPETELVATWPEDVAALLASEPVEGAIERRPEVVIETARAAVARAEEGAARADSRPSLTAGLGYMHFEQTALPGQSGYNAIVAVGLPIHDRKRGEIRAARARAEAARFGESAARAKARAEIEGTRNALNIARERLEAIVASRSGELEPLMSMAETSYKAGLQSVLELLDAYRVERDYQIARARAQAALWLAIEEHAHALGHSTSVKTTTTTEEIQSRKKHGEIEG